MPKSENDYPPGEVLVNKLFKIVIRTKAYEHNGNKFQECFIHDKLSGQKYYVNLELKEK
jgi:hypothetical protein